jgi:hypothetical protein
MKDEVDIVDANVMKNVWMHRVLSQKRRLFGLLLIGVLIFVHASSLSAQATSSISGRVDDTSGAAAPGVALTVTSMETGSTRTAISDGSGEYRVLSLPVGRYEVKAEKAGFEVEVRQGLDLVVGQEAVVNMTLRVGAVSQQVTVTGDASLVNTTTASTSGLVSEEQVKDLPLNGRSYDNLITLNAGAVNYTSNTATVASNAGAGNYFSVDGRAPYQNLFLLNGAEFTGVSQLGITPGGASGQMLGIDAVREFNVVSGTYGAEYGKRAGSQISIVTQSGTNKFHGGVFEFVRNSALDARNYFDQSSIPPFQRNQFGGSAGGPIQKDKTFIFGNYEGFRSTLGVSDVAFVPDNNARQGILPCGVITPLPAGCIAPGTAGYPAGGTTPTVVPNYNSGMSALMAYWPVANGPVLGGGVAEDFANPVQTIREDFGTMRVDHNFSDRDTLSGVYTIDDGINQTPLQDPVFINPFTLREQVLTLSETRVFSPSIVNVFTVGFSRAANFYEGTTIAPFPSNATFVQGEQPGLLSIGGNNYSGTITSGGSNGVYNVKRNDFTYEDGVQIIKGKHQISVGAWFERIQANNDRSATRGNGSASFTTLESFLQGTAATFFYTPPPGSPLYWRSLEGAWYAQDTIQLAKNLSLRVGVRHEFTNIWNEKNGNAATFVFGSNGILETNTKIGNPIFSQNNAKWLFGPRVGLAWDVFGDGKTSVRAAAGTHYDLLDNLGFLYDQTPPFNGASSFANVPILSLIPEGPGAVPPTCGPGVPTTCTTYSPQGPQANPKTPTVEAWNLEIQQQLTTNMSLNVAYVGSRGFHGILVVDDNSIAPQICANTSGCVSGGNLSNTAANRGLVPVGAQYIPTGAGGVPNTRPNPYLSSGNSWFMENNSSYNALQVSLIRRLSNDLQFRLNYTYGKNEDLGSGLIGSGNLNEPAISLDAYHPQVDWGPSGQNVKHEGVGNVSYNLPIGHGKLWFGGASGIEDKLAGGWQLNGIVTLLTGFPFTPLDGSNRSGDGNSHTPDRPNWNSSFTGPVKVGTPTEWYNPNAFALNTAGTYGNVGRNALTGPGFADVDFSVFKNMQFERVGTQFRAEFFNILNHPNFSYPNATVFSGASYNPSAGIITATADTAREIQFGVKVSF